MAGGGDGHVSVLVIKHGDMVPAGHLAGLLLGWGAAGKAAHGDVERCLVYEGDPIPDTTDWAGIVSLGGLMGAYEEDRYPWLAEEKRLLAAAVEAGVPVLGLCLGCQVLADALGGRAFRADEPEIGMMAVPRTAAGAADPVLRHLDTAVPVWHRDTWELPPDATLLAATERHPHAFRAGPGLGIQSHPEATPFIVARWIAGHTGDDLIMAGVDPATFLADVRAGAAAQEEMAARLFGAWVAGLR
jgi:GMP synthase (glutamine-hydrolysing)